MSHSPRHDVLAARRARTWRARLGTVASLGAVCAWLIAGVPAAAVAQDKDAPSLEEIESKAGQAYASGDYDTAIALLIQANQIAPHPNYLLNIAISYTKKGDCSNASLWAKNAIGSTDGELPAESRQRAQAILDDCKATAAVTPPNGNNTVTPPPGDGKGKGKTDTKDDGMGWAPIVGYSTLGAGGLMLLGAGLLDLNLGSDIDELNTLRTQPNQEAAYTSLQDEISSSKTTVTALYVSGFVFAATGAYFAFLHERLVGPSEESDPAVDGAASGEGSAVVSPWWSPDGGGVSFQLTY